MQDVCKPWRQNSQVPSDQANGMITKSPGFTVRTSAPIEATTPTASCPITRPVLLGSIDLYGQRSLPQMQARETVTTASVGLMMAASGTFSVRTSPAAYMTVALT